MELHIIIRGKTTEKEEPRAKSELTAFLTFPTQEALFAPPGPKDKM